MGNTLSFEISRTAEWRAKKALRHPEDWRNAEAAKRLRELAEMEADGSLEEQLDRLEEETDTERFSESRSMVLSDIGFRWDPPHVDDVLRRIIDAVPVPTA